MPDQVVSTRCVLGVVVFGERREPGRVYQFSRAQELDLSLSSPGAFERVYPREQDLPRLSVDLRTMPPARMDVAPTGDAEQVPGADVFAGEEGTAGEDGEEEGATETAIEEEAGGEMLADAGPVSQTLLETALQALLETDHSPETAEQVAEAEATEQSEQPEAEPEATEPAAVPDVGAKPATSRRARTSGGRQRRGKEPAAGAGE